MLRTRITDHWSGLLAALVLVAGTLALFLPALAGHYLYHDDWVHRVARPWAFRSSPSFLHLVVMGRPVCSLCTFVNFSLFETIGDAGIGRLAVILTLAAAGIATARFLQRVGVDRWVATAWSFAMLALPGALAIGYWLGVGCLAAGWLLAVLAALAAQQSLRGRRPLAWSALAAALLVAAFATHQQIAMIYIALLAAVAARAERAALWPSLRRWLGIGAVAAATYLTGYQFFARIVFPGIYARYQAVDPERALLLGDLGGGLAWLATRLGPRGAALWFDDLMWPWAPAIGLGGMLVSLGLVYAGSRRGFALRLALIAGVVVLAGAPAVPTAFRLETYRLALPISVAIVAVIAGSYGRGWIDRASALGLAAILAWYGSGRLDAMIEAAARETATLQSAIAAAGAPADAPVEIVVPPPDAALRTDEFGLLSSRFLFNAEAALTVIRREHGLAPVAVTVSEGAPAAGDAPRLTIDLRPLAEQLQRRRGD